MQDARGDPIIRALLHREPAQQVPRVLGDWPNLGTLYQSYEPPAEPLQGLQSDLWEPAVGRGK